MALWRGRELTSTVSTSEEEKEGREGGRREGRRRKGREGGRGRRRGKRRKRGREIQLECGVAHLLSFPIPQHLHGVRGRIVLSWYDPNNLDSLHEVCQFVAWGTEKHTMVSYGQWVYCERDKEIAYLCTVPDWLM